MSNVDTPRPADHLDFVRDLFGLPDLRGARHWRLLRGMAVKETDVTSFANYLVANGAEVRERTNPYELIRYWLPEVGVVVVYQNSKGNITWGPHGRAHWDRFKASKPLDVHRRAGGNARQRLIDQLIERDGETCCYCGQFLDGDITIEHLLSIADGGNNLPANTALAHESCNHAVGSASVFEKIQLRDLIKQAVAMLPPWEKFDIRKFENGVPE